MVDASQSTSAGDGATAALPAAGQVGPRVLLVDPDDQRRPHLRRRLVTDLGATVVAVPDQTAALTWLADEDADCLVVADHLPGTTGRELLQWLGDGPAAAPGVLLVEDREDSVAAGDLALDVGAVVPTADATAPDRLAAAVRRTTADDREPLAAAAATMFDAADVGAIVHDADGEIAYANTRAGTLAPVDAPLAGRPVWAVLPTVAREAFPDYWDAMDPGEVLTQPLIVDGDEGDPLALDVVTVRVGTGDAAANLVVLLERRGLRGQDAAFADVVGYELTAWLEEGQAALGDARRTGERYHLERLDRALVRLGDVLETELDVARGGVRVENPSAHAVNAVARAAWEHVATGQASLQVRTGASVLADRELLLRAFEHLFRNCRTHGDPAGTVVVDVDGGTLVVEDDGPGVPAEYRDRVFDRGFSTTGDEGLGLAIVRWIAEAHGWTVTMTSSRLGGARVEVRGVAVVDDLERPHSREH